MTLSRRSLLGLLGALPVVGRMVRHVEAAPVETEPERETIPCNVCGEPLMIFTSPREFNGWALMDYGGIFTACGADPSHNTAGRYLEAAREQLRRKSTPPATGA